MKNGNKKTQDEIKQESNVEETVEEKVQEEEQEHDRQKIEETKGEKSVEELEREVEYLKDQLARAVADYRNFEKRSQEDKQEYVKYANRDLLVRILPAFDMLFLAGKYVEDEGVKLTIKRIHDVFGEIGVEKIKTEGTNFDPTLMECVETQVGEEGKVLKEIKPGFTLHGKLLSPATVIVGKKE